MYKLTIDTTIGPIYLLVDDIKDPDIDEIIHQPWVKSVTSQYNEMEDNENGKFKRLIKVKGGDEYGKTR